MITSCLYSVSAVSKPYFNPAALGIGSTDPLIDISQFQQLSERQFQTEGRYFVSVSVNRQAQPGLWIEFRYHPVKKQLLPHVSRKQWLMWGLRTDAAPEFERADDSAPIDDITQWVSALKVTFDAAQQSLDIIIPQRFFMTAAQRTSDAALWDHGITAFLLDYDYRILHTRDRHYRDTRQSLSLRSGFNHGAWRFRHQDYLDKTKEKQSWQSQRTWGYRAIAPLKGELQLGELYSSDPVFDSRAYTGIRLVSREAMHPQDRQGYAPVIRGITAHSAQLTIKQQDMVLRQVSLPGGEFEINNLYDGLQGADLEVLIEESDGTVQHYFQPGAYVPVMLREGRIKYTLDAGKHTRRKDGSDTYFMQGTVAYGINSFLTLYGGGYAARRAVSGAMGAGINMGAAGGISLDWLTYQQAGARYQRYRINYQKAIWQTGSSLYLRAGETVRVSDSNGSELCAVSAGRQWSGQFQQFLAGWGSLSLGYRYSERIPYQPRKREYYRASDRVWDTGYYGNFRYVGYGVNYQYRKSGAYQRADNRISISFSVPLEFGGQRLRSHFYYYHQAAGSGTQTSVSGTAGDDYRLSYTLHHGYQHQTGTHRRGGELRWRHDTADLQGSFSSDGNHNIWNGGIQGGVVIHRKGLTLSRPLGESNALVDMDGVGNISLMNANAASTDSRGFSIIPQLNNYNQNTVRIDPETLPENVDIAEPVQQIIPSKGAIVPVRFDVQKGHRVIYALKTRTGSVPFGASVQVKRADGSTVSGIAGDDGEVYLSGLPDSGLLQVKWGDSPAQQCESDIAVPPENQWLVTMTLLCQ
ncbi:fimbria/pilus outer membrane usher protein [Morganella psychrotolerans]|uniref:fimbria/pilus outer membrane usher protein n=1 Tax=Morganella psychrotolerans TaxID=368603 RepID=UPI0039AFC763